MGIPEEQVTAKVAALTQAFEKQATDAVSRTAIDWAKDNAREALSQAALQQVNHGSLAGYHALAKSHMENLATIDPAAILNSRDAKERQIRQEADGRITLYIPGVGRTDWKTAIRSRLIGPKFID